MSLNSEETAWFYHSGRWSRIKRSGPRAQRQSSRIRPRCAPLRASLRGRYRRWCQLGPLFPSSDYAGVIVTVYSYTGNDDAPEYLIKVDSLSRDELIYVEALPDLLDVLDLLAPIASNGILVDAYGQGPRR